MNTCTPKTIHRRLKCNEINQFSTRLCHEDICVFSMLHALAVN